MDVNHASRPSVMLQRPVHPVVVPFHNAVLCRDAYFNADAKPSDMFLGARAFTEALPLAHMENARFLSFSFSNSDTITLFHQTIHSPWSCRGIAATSVKAALTLYH